MRFTHPFRRKNEAGFTLIEMAIVLVIGGIMFAMFGSVIIKYVRDTRVKTTQARIKDVNEAMRVYALANKALPCAARRDLAPTDPNYGTALTTAQCQAAMTGTSRSNGVRIGMVPFKALGLTDEDSYDAWGSRLIYAVTESLTDPATYDLKSGGKISIVDSTGASVIDPPDRAPFLIVSVGPDLEGGYGVDGSATDTPRNPCTNTGGKLDEENCNNDSTFRSTMLTSESNTKPFDDFISYGGLQLETSDIPDGAIMAFQTGVCPKDWKAFIEAQGRLIVGQGQYVAHVLPTDTPGWSEHNYALGEEGGNGTRREVTTLPASKASYPNLPPYFSYIYCVKDEAGTYVPGPPPVPLPPPAPPPPPPSPPSPPSPPPSPPPPSRVVCTHYYRRGRMPDWMLRAEVEYTYAYFSECTIRGYHFWGIPLVNLMRKYEWVENILYRPTMWRAEDIAYQMGLRDKPNYIGRALRIMVEPLCFLIGIFVPAQDWRTVHADVKNMLRPDMTR